MGQHVEVTAGAGGSDSHDFARMLREMYEAWGGDLSHEPGVHRLVRISPFDWQRRRHTCFALVIVDGEDGCTGEGIENQVRSYFLHPAQRVVDHRLGNESPHATRILAGELDLILDPEVNQGAEAA